MTKPATPLPWRARVDSRGWWRIGPVRIEPRAGESPADRKTLAMRIERLPILERDRERLIAALRELVRNYGGPSLKHLDPDISSHQILLNAAALLRELGE